MARSFERTKQAKSSDEPRASTSTRFACGWRHTFPSAAVLHQVHARILDTKENGVPQSRRRVYVCGILTKYARDAPEFVWPAPVDKPDIEGFLDPVKPGDKSMPSSEVLLNNILTHLETIKADKSKTNKKKHYVGDVQCSASRNGQLCL
eukprot:1447329-Alexandrium_andersonii.AAC.1